MVFICRIIPATAKVQHPAARLVIRYDSIIGGLRALRAGSWRAYPGGAGCVGLRETRLRAFVPNERTGARWGVCGVGFKAICDE